MPPQQATLTIKGGSHCPRATQSAAGPGDPLLARARRRAGRPAQWDWGAPPSLSKPHRDTGSLSRRQGVSKAWLMTQHGAGRTCL